MIVCVVLFYILYDLRARTYETQFRTYNFAYDVQPTISDIIHWTDDIVCFEDVVCLTYNITTCYVFGGVPTMSYGGIIGM
jgi:hypothetical protein